MNNEEYKKMRAKEIADQRKNRDENIVVKRTPEQIKETNRIRKQKQREREDKIIENILKLVCDICFHFDPLLMKESFWMCFETGVKFMLKKKKKSSI